MRLDKHNNRRRARLDTYRQEYDIYNTHSVTRQWVSALLLYHLPVSTSSLFPHMLRVMEARDNVVGVLSAREDPMWRRWKPLRGTTPQEWKLSTSKISDGTGIYKGHQHFSRGGSSVPSANNISAPAILEQITPEVPVARVGSLKRMILLPMSLRLLELIDGGGMGFDM